MTATEHAPTATPEVARLVDRVLASSDAIHLTGEALARLQRGESSWADELQRLQSDSKTGEGQR
jgi:hypothetical protein